MESASWLLRRLRKNRGNWRGLYRLGGLGLNRNWIRIALRHHYVKAGLAALFFWLDDVLFLHPGKIVGNPFMLLASQAALADVHSCPGKVRRSYFAFSRRGIVIRAHQVPLLLGRPNSGRNLQRSSKLLVELAAHIVHELHHPRTRIPPILLKIRVDRHVLSADKRHKHTAFFELLELSVILDARQSSLIDLGVLLEQGVPGSTQLWRNRRSVIAQAAKVSTAVMATRRADAASTSRPARQAMHVSLDRDRDHNQHE